MAREDEVENEQEVAQPTEADATEASVDEEYVEDAGDDVDDGKVGVIITVITPLEKKNILLTSFLHSKAYLM